MKDEGRQSVILFSEESDSEDPSANLIKIDESVASGAITASEIINRKAQIVVDIEKEE